MKFLLAVASCAGMLCVGLAGPAAAGKVGPFEGNDTGGIIAWSPQAWHHRHAIAGDHCLRYGKRHRITSVYAHYGQYIGFACYRPRGRDGVILRVRY